MPHRAYDLHYHAGKQSVMKLGIPLYDWDQDMGSPMP